jgi:glyoxylase-like metal-dependent hydrolase (beta-lactamase superfamily II)
MATPIKIGDLTIHRIVEQEGPFFDMLAFFPDLGRERLEQHRAWLAPRYMDPASDRIVLCIQSYLIETAHHTILVDTCVGNNKERPSRPFWHRMASARWHQALNAAGFGVEDIDYVMCTHLHGDHVGWNTRLENGRWVPTFPKARYLMADRELAYWSSRHDSTPELCPWIADSVLPIIATDRALVVTSDHRLDDAVGLMPTPGHTIDHFSVEVRSGGAQALITGDLVHSPLQVLMPELGMFSDYDSKLAGETRRRVFGCLCESKALVCTAHFASPSTGRIGHDGTAFTFEEA